MIKAKLECIIRADNTLGEGPRWDTKQAALFWVDIEAGKLQRLEPDSGAYEAHDVTPPLAMLSFTADEALLLAVGHELGFCKPGAAAWRAAARVDIDPAVSRFNDGAVDPQGRLWIGTMGGGARNKLYRVDADLSITEMESGIGVANGIDWSPDGRTMYFTDSAQRTIYAYDFLSEEGLIRNRRVFAQVAESAGVPDGLAVDSAGHIWSAHWDGWRLTRYDPAGNVDYVLEMPVQRPTSPAFGGADLTDLYITSARTGLTAAELVDQPLAGGLFRVQTAVAGRPGNRFIYRPGA